MNKLKKKNKSRKEKGGNSLEPFAVYKRRDFARREQPRHFVTKIEIGIPLE